MRKSGKNQLHMDASYLINHKASWVPGGDIASSYFETYFLSTSQNEAIKVEELEDQQDDGSIFTIDNVAFIKEESPVAEKSFKLSKALTCGECGKLFGYESCLNNHMLIHSGKKLFSCNLCEKAFAHRSTLNRHMLIHNGKNFHHNVSTYDELNFFVCKSL